ncbi:MAG: cyclophilin-like fold protein [Dehalococcoidia bacterium]|tara:strand:+ start:1708 stop:2076 length:369 start_codon:yes stop_codon:yes gene_type:complete
MYQIKIEFENITIEADLNNSETADNIKKILPITNSVNIWGDEIYFPVDINDEEIGAKEIVELGDIGYWPPGNAFCLFFGLTPLSQGDEIRPASPINIIGKIKSDINILKSVKSGEKVIVSLI